LNYPQKKLLKYAGQEIRSKKVESFLKGLHIDIKNLKKGGVVQFQLLELIYHPRPT
jgi:hypothetical protein